uniref:Uncharacterized protein n=1 Tax=Kalanchoe fedtschenkoi TaxID=63787 RepID=A0A7N1A5X1_KALFE
MQRASLTNTFLHTQPKTNGQQTIQPSITQHHKLLCSSIKHHLSPTHPQSPNSSDPKPLLKFCPLSHSHKHLVCITFQSNRTQSPNPVVPNSSSSHSSVNTIHHPQQQATMPQQTAPPHLHPRETLQPKSWYQHRHINIYTTG